MAALFSCAAAAEVPQAARDADVVVLGEQHDNPAHHQRQAEWTSALAPQALVFEMLKPRQAANANFDWADQAELDAAIDWSQNGWPSFDLYFPVFEAARGVAIFGALVPREELRDRLENPIVKHPLAALFGLDQPVDAKEQAAREALQAAAHCDALPEEMLPVMVTAQRLRDVALADATLRALRATGGPIVVITGNGHARSDWGMPALLAYAARDVTVFVLGQGEDGADVTGTFNLTLDAPSPKRADPCDAFKQ
ncbi:ChaN family lipoprotein [Sulfitobacter sp.]|uniref:ChaN family lipoprotein n=1 Tax=Sulfitobacter sp. TaxID=1903071 RepID=UPI003003358E